MRPWKRWAQGVLSAALFIGCSKGGMEAVEDRDLAANSPPDFSITARDLGSADLSGYPDLAVMPTGDALWQKGVGGSGDDQATSVVSDRSGNVYVTGVFVGSVDFGGGALVSAGLGDMFLVKYDPAGKLVFAKRFGNNQQDSGARLAIDSANNVVLLGSFQGAVDFGGGPLNSAGGADLVVAKFSPTGQHLWSRRYGGILTEDPPYGLAVDTHDNVFVTAVFAGQVDFGTGPIDAYNGVDSVLFKTAADGTTSWVRRIGGNGYERIGGVTTDRLDNVIIAGSFSEVIDFGSGFVTADNRHKDGFVAKYGPDNTLAWVRRMSGYSPDTGYPTGIASDSAGNLTVTGWFNGGIDLGSGPLSCSGQYDGFVGKYAPDGRPLWSIRVGGTDSDQSYGIAVDAAGFSVITGSFRGAADFGGGLRTSAGYQDVFVAKYNPSGSHVWSRTMGGKDTEEGLAAALDPLGNVLLSGYYQGTPDFGSGPLPAATGQDLFVVKRAP